MNADQPENDVADRKFTMLYIYVIVNLLHISQYHTHPHTQATSMSIISSRCRMSSSLSFEQGPNLVKAVNDDSDMGFTLSRYTL